MKLTRGGKLGELLLSEGLLSEQDLLRALEAQSKDNKRLGEVLIDRNFLSTTALLSALSRNLGVMACNVRHGLIDPLVALLLVLF
jgi:hypothetical protein